MSSGLQSKVIVVTGGTAGMGEAFSRRAASDGATVVIGARDKTRGEQLAADIRKDGGLAVFVPTDVTVEEQVANLVRTAVSEFGRLDGAFNNAGGGNALGKVREIDESFWRATLDLNLTSIFFSLKHEIPAIVASGGGSIVNNASTAGVIGDAAIAAYTAAKHGVVGLTRAAALDAAREGVRINALVTGLVDTPLWRQVAAANPEVEDYFLGLQPSGRIGRQEDIAAFAAFLLSDASTYITGAALPIDGGLTAK
ncbi:SDR family NAD(P)-dependent oxidoreductase [Streptomyces sp. NBC_00872]|uniref:SDR family NAD(P)-dependent oxidoreductase n=1 Tax=Streptomyces sp. NBC_00872 TaxID=2903686 RepID=UPI00386F4CDA|nr:SDR family oxidoreductase [Streptomyces sp. NBC_00872]